MKIVVRMPRSYREALYSLPLLHALQVEFPDVQPDLIQSAEINPLIQLLPFECRTHAIDHSEVEGMMQTHKYCYNLREIFNVDLYLSLDNSLSGSLMGFCFRSKYSIGYKQRMSRLYLQKSYLPNFNKDLSSEWLQFLEDYTGKHYTFSGISGKAPGNNLSEKENYIVVQLVSDGNEIINKTSSLLETLALLEDVSLVFVGPKETYKQVDELIFKLEKLKASAKLVNACNNYNDFAAPAFMAHAIGVISSDPTEVFLAHYLKTPSIYVPLSESLPRLLDRCFYDRGICLETADLGREAIEQNLAQIQKLFFSRPLTTKLSLVK